MFDDLLLLQRGGYEVYMGPLGHHGRDIVRYLEAVPGTPRCPKGMNPASYMLDVLLGMDSSTAAPGPGVASGGASGDGGASKSAAIATASAADDVAGSLAARAAARDFDYQSWLHGTPAWAAAQATIAAASTPAKGAVPLHFDAIHARSLGVQFTTLLQRTVRSYWRDLPMNWSRFRIVVLLSLLFGTIYYDINTSGVGGVQSAIAVAVMVTMQLAIQQSNVRECLFVFLVVRLRRHFSPSSSPLAGDCSTCARLRPRACTATQRSLAPPPYRLVANALVMHLPRRR
jgi:hypothetical protein